MDCTAADEGFCQLSSDCLIYLNQRNDGLIYLTSVRGRRGSATARHSRHLTGPPGHLSDGDSRCPLDASTMSITVFSQKITLTSSVYDDRSTDATAKMLVSTRCTGLDSVTCSLAWPTSGLGLVLNLMKPTFNLSST